MDKCGDVFHKELGKSKILNEMVKLGSKKPSSSVPSSTNYFSTRSPGNEAKISPDVKKRSRTLLKNWSRQYNNIPEFKKAYDQISEESNGNKPTKKASEPTHNVPQKKGILNKKDIQASTLYNVSPYLKKK